MFELKGKIEFDPINVTKKHHNQSTWKKVALVKFDCDISQYYAWFVEKRFNFAQNDRTGLLLNKPLRGTHITIINDRVDSEVYTQAREIFHGKEITLFYDPTYIRANEKGHWWIKVYSDDARNIRTVMGLTPDPYFGLHLTLGRATDLRLEQSNYIIEQCKRFNL